MLCFLASFVSVECLLSTEKLKGYGKNVFSSVNDIQHIRHIQHIQHIQHTQHMQELQGYGKTLWVQLDRILHATHNGRSLECVLSLACVLSLECVL
jgi:hypothetical protein